MEPVPPWPPFVTALVVAVPVLLLVIAGLLLYVCCARRYKLNWYERSLLDRGKEQSSGVASHLLGASGSQSSHGTWFSTATSVASHQGSFNSTPVLVPETVVEYVTVRGNMGSYPSSPVSSPTSDRSSVGGWEDLSTEAQSHTQHQIKRISPSALLSPWDNAPRTMDNDHADTDVYDSSSDHGPKRNSISKEVPSLISALPFRRFSAGSTPVPEPGSPSWRYGGAPMSQLLDHEGNRQQTPPARTKRSNSLIPQLAMPLTNYLKSGASSKDSSNSSLHESVPPEPVAPVQVPGGGTYHRRRRASMQDALDHTKINASLYQYERPELRKQESIGSIPEDNNLGSLHLSLTYDPEQSLLTVRLIQAVDLMVSSSSGTTDPYCQLRLLPNKKLILQTKIKRKTTSPEFKEDFIFDVAQAEMAFKTLEILVFDFDQYSRDECMGQVQIPLGSLDLSGDAVVLWRGVMPYENQTPKQTQGRTTDNGEIMFSLAYLPSAERLTVVVMKARNIRGAEDTKTLTSSKSASPFVRISLTSGGKKLKRKKTSTKRNTNNPVWNEALVFNISKDFLNSIQIELSVYSESLLGNSELLGRVNIGSNSSSEELSHWNDVINSRSALARWHRLSQDET